LQKKDMEIADGVVIGVVSEGYVATLQAAIFLCTDPGRCP